MPAVRLYPAMALAHQVQQRASSNATQPFFATPIVGTDATGQMAGHAQTARVRNAVPDQRTTQIWLVRAVARRPSAPGEPRGKLRNVGHGSGDARHLVFNRGFKAWDTSSGHRGSRHFMPCSNRPPRRSDPAGSFFQTIADRERNQFQLLTRNDARSIMTP